MKSSTRASNDSNANPFTACPQKLTKSNAIEPTTVKTYIATNHCLGMPLSMYDLVPPFASPRVLSSSFRPLADILWEGSPSRRKPPLLAFSWRTPFGMESPSSKPALLVFSRRTPFERESPSRKSSSACLLLADTLWEGELFKEKQLFLSSTTNHPRTKRNYKQKHARPPTPPSCLHSCQGFPQEVA